MGILLRGTVVGTKFENVEIVSDAPVPYRVTKLVTAFCLNELPAAKRNEVENAPVRQLPRAPPSQSTQPQGSGGVAGPGRGRGRGRARLITPRQEESVDLGEVTGAPGKPPTDRQILKDMLGPEYSLQEGDTSTPNDPSRLSTSKDMTTKKPEDASGGEDGRTGSGITSRGFDVELPLPKGKPNGYIMFLQDKRSQSGLDSSVRIDELITLFDRDWAVSLNFN